MKLCGTWPWGFQCRGMLAECECSIEKGVGGVGSGLVGLHMKGAVAGESFISLGID